jgi:pimeloyl-ACP methyl ester carboxylesterase
MDAVIPRRHAPGLTTSNAAYGLRISQVTSAQSASAPLIANKEPNSSLNVQHRNLVDILMSFFEVSALAGLVLIVTAAVAFAAAKLSEKRNPPLGRFLNVDGVKVHYVERGAGPEIIWLHGNVSMLQDFLASGIAEVLENSFRFIAIDRPGYGFTERPRSRRWGAVDQADLLAGVMQELGIGSAIIVGHSWGTLVATSFAQRHPARVRALVLLSGYYFPKLRLDILSVKPLASPVLGDVLRYTVAPIAGLLAMPLLFRAMFGPPTIPERFKREFPVSMLVRPWQIRASAEEGAMMNEEAEALQDRYGQIAVNTHIVAGDADRIVSPQFHSEALAERLQNCALENHSRRWAYGAPFSCPTDSGDD